MADIYVRPAVSAPGTGTNRASWAASTAYAVGDRVGSLAATTEYWIFECTGAGTSGATEPTWTKTDGAAQPADGTVTWVCRAPDSYADATFTLFRAFGTGEAAGDRIFMDDTLALTNAASTTFTIDGTIANPSQILSVTMADPPTTLTAGAKMATTGASNLSVNGSFYAYGWELWAADGAAQNADVILNSTTSGANLQVWEACYFDLGNGSSADFTIGNATNNVTNYVQLIDCTVRMRHASTQWDVRSNFSMTGGGLDPAGALISLFCQFVGSSSQNRNASFINADLSRMSASAQLVSYGTGQSANAEFRNCKLPASWTGTIANNITTGSSRVSLYECMFGTTRRILWIVSDAGEIIDETVVLKSGGASDGFDPISWGMTTGSTANEFTRILYTDWIAVPIFATGSKTVEFDFVHDSVAGGELEDDEIWLEVDYLGTASSRLGSRVTDKRAGVLTAPVDQDTSAATWAGTSGFANTPIKQKVGVTFTANEEGVAMCRIALAKPSTTIYLDPKPTVT